MILSDTLLQNLRAVHDDADPWLEALPETLARLESDWKLRVIGPVPQLSYNLVLYAERFDKTPCILKLSPPTEEVAREGEALATYAGDGICRLLERDDAVSALLLERVLPGLSLQESWTLERDDAHTRITAELMRRLWRPVKDPHPFCPLSRWARALRDDSGSTIPAALRERAMNLLNDLSTSADPVLLHADLHHGNILTAVAEPYLAIDPKGIVGAKGYDVGPYLLNPIPVPAADLVELLPRRLAIFSELLGLSTGELAAWGFVHAVLSACWSAEEAGDGSWNQHALTVARGLEPYL